MADNKESKFVIDKKKKKLIITLSVIVCVVVALIIVIASCRNTIYSNVLYRLMPESQVSTLSDGTELTVYVEKNKNYDPKTMPPLSAFEFYYVDENGNKVNVADDKDLEYGEADYQTAFVFLAGEKLQNIKSTVTPIVVVIVLVAMAVGIYFWFKSWSRRQDEEKTRKYQHKNKNRH